MALFNLFKSRNESIEAKPVDLRALLAGYSIEVMPRTASKIDDFKAILPEGTRIYIAHIEGTPIADMVATASRLAKDGFAVMPHIPARLIPNLSTLETWLRSYSGEAGVTQALIIGGGPAKPAGDLHSSLQLLESGLFDKYGFTRLHVAGHPEGAGHIDRDGSTRIVDDMLRLKQAFAERSGADMAITTQFAFDAKAVIAWAERIAAAGINLPIHLGVAGPARLQTLIKFAIECGIGPSLGVLQKRALDLSKLLAPYEPLDMLTEIAAYKASHPDSLIQQIHVFPLGGIRPSVEWMNSHGGIQPKRPTG